MTEPGGVLYLASEWPWPPRTGGKQRIAAIVAALRESGVPLTVLAPDADSPWPGSEPGIREMRRRRGSPGLRMQDVAASLLAGEHVVLRRARQAGLVQAFDAAVADARPSVVILGRPFYGPFVDAARVVAGTVIADIDESLTRVAGSTLRWGAGAARLRALLERGALARFERREYRHMDEIWVSSRIEEQAVRALAPSTTVRIIPNISPRPPRAVDPSVPHEVAAMAFVGWYGYSPNERAAIELMDSILPRVRALGGPAHVSLIGRGPTGRMARLAAHTPGVDITGEVDDVGPYLQRAGVLVCPIRSGGGTRIKILEAMALGVPVISTTRGAEGIDVVPGRHLLVEDTPAGMAEAFVRLAREPLEGARLAAAASKLVEERYGPAAVQAALRAAMAAASAGRPVGRTPERASGWSP